MTTPKFNDSNNIVDLISDDEDDRKPPARDMIEPSTYDLTLDDDDDDEDDKEKDAEDNVLVLQSVRNETKEDAAMNLTRPVAMEDETKRQAQIDRDAATLVAERLQNEEDYRKQLDKIFRDFALPKWLHQEEQKALATRVFEFGTAIASMAQMDYERKQEQNEWVTLREKWGMEALVTAQKARKDPPALKMTRKDSPTAELRRKNPPPVLATEEKGPPAVATTVKFIGFIIYDAPYTLTSQEDPFKQVLSSPSSSMECAFCLEALDCDVIEMNVCRHQFHAACIREAFQATENKCPECMTYFPEPKRGKSPSGTMKVSVWSQDCSGFPGAGTIVVSYRIRDSYTRPFYTETSRPFHGVDHVTYLPNTSCGQALLKRLEYAFQHGLSFLVVDLNSTADIDGMAVKRIYKYIATCSPCHKESFTSTRSSWSDPDYSKKCHQALDEMKVPPSEVLRHDSNISFD